MTLDPWQRPAPLTSPYPGETDDRDAWILARRPARPFPDPHHPQGWLSELERSESGEVVPVLTVFLTSRECPWRCLMCDLWRHTTRRPIPAGAVPAQLDEALAAAGQESRQIKLYNAGSFFDAGAVPPRDYAAIAARLRRFERVVVECHPALLGERCLRFRELLVEGAAVRESHGPRLEVAMGLETAHPEVLARLNKRMTLDQFRQAAEFLRSHEIALRVFVLVQPPFMRADEAFDWANRSVEVAFDCGATAVTLIPTRLGNGALEALARQGVFAQPSLATLEAVLAAGVACNRGRVFADLWDLEKFSECSKCFPQRAERMRQMNLRQIVLPTILCGCPSGTGA